MRHFFLRSFALAMLAALFWPQAASADSLKSHQTVDEAVQHFMTLADQGNLAKSYAYLHAYLGVSGDAYDKAAQKAVQYFQQVFKQVGKPSGAVLVRREAIKNQFYRVTMLQKFPSAAFAWQFTFYRPGDGWELVGVSYTTDIDDLYQTVEK